MAGAKRRTKRVVASWRSRPESAPRRWSEPGMGCRTSSFTVWFCLTQRRVGRCSFSRMPPTSVSGVFSLSFLGKSSIVAFHSRTWLTSLWDSWVGLLKAYIAALGHAEKGSCRHGEYYRHAWVRQGLWPETFPPWPRGGWSTPVQVLIKQTVYYFEPQANFWCPSPDPYQYPLERVEIPRVRGSTTLNKTGSSTVNQYYSVCCSTVHISHWPEEQTTMLNFVSQLPKNVVQNDFLSKKFWTSRKVSIFWSQIGSKWTEKKSKVDLTCRLFSLFSEPHRMSTKILGVLVP